MGPPYTRDMAPRRLHMLRQAQNGKCYLCGRLVPPPDAFCIPSQKPTRDHIRPRCKLLSGGERPNVGPPNVGLCHADCNNKKGSRMPYACEVFYGEIVFERLVAMFPDTYGEDAQRLWPIKRAITDLAREIAALTSQRDRQSA